MRLVFFRFGFGLLRSYPGLLLLMASSCRHCRCADHERHGDGEIRAATRHEAYSDDAKRVYESLQGLKHRLLKTRSLDKQERYSSIFQVHLEYSAYTRTHTQPGSICRTLSFEPEKLKTVVVHIVMRVPVTVEEHQLKVLVIGIVVVTTTPHTKRNGC